MSGKLDQQTETELKASRRTSETPFQNITRHGNPALNLAVAKSWSDEISRPISNAGIKFTFDALERKKQKITIGYLSNNYGDHPVSHLMQYMFGLHDRKDFNIFCYSYGKDDGSQYRKTIAQQCDKFVDLFDLSYLDSARCIYEDQVDILVDLVGHTENNRMGISAYRPAPVQVSYLGFLGSTGADFMDYIITDRIVTPDEHARYYTEKLIYMPHTYQVNNNLVSNSENQIKKSDFNLPENSFVLCSFNKPYKIEPQIFDTWMKILKKTDDSILWLYNGGAIAEKNLKDDAKASGVDPDRLIFASMMPLENHLERLKLADLALDTRIYNGGATTSNALWAGIPVITMLGGHFVSRMTASSLDAVGLPEFITHSLEEYETLAVRLAKNPEELSKIKRRLKKNLLKSSLFDTQGFVTDLETAYRQIWEIYLSNQKPRQIVVHKHTSNDYC
jgi:protein O-GlcNAc transferase